MIQRPVHSLRSYLLDRLVLRPSRQPIDHGDQQRITLKSHGNDLETFIRRVRDGKLLHDKDEMATMPEIVMLKFPGTAGRAERSTLFPAEFVGDHHVDIWTWNPPGYGRSQGRASLKRIAAAANDFYEQVKSWYGHSPRIWLVGNSLGCATAMHVAASTNDEYLAGLVLRNPPPVDLVVRNVATSYPCGQLIHPVADRLIDSMNVIFTASQVTAPAVFLECEADSLVPPELQQKVRNAYGGKHRCVVLTGLEHDGLLEDIHIKPICDATRWLVSQTIE